MKIFLFVLFLGLSFNVHAYPEMIRHGYTTCTTCHVSPSGGGITTNYGRSISKELLSKWSYEGEEQQFHGFLKNDDLRSWIDGSRDHGFNVSGNTRYIQTHLETQSFSQGRSFFMQRDLEIAAKLEKWVLVTSYGFVYNPTENDDFELRRLYLMYNLSELVSVRAGRFLPTYGLMTSDHYLSIKQRLGLGQLSERDALEMNFITDSWSGFMSVSSSPDSKSNLNNEKALSLGINYHLSDKFRLGVSYWNSNQEDKKRDITGVNALLGFSKKLYSLFEFDHQVEQLDTGEIVKGQFLFLRLGYEAIKGLHLLAQLDASQTNLDDIATRFYSYGTGITFYPRPHFEFQFLWSRPKFNAQQFADSGFLIMHYYL